MSNNVNYHKLAELKDKIENKMATEAEKREYVELLYWNGSITESQYKQYVQNKDLAGDVLKAALIIGGIALLGAIISDLLD